MSREKRIVIFVFLLDLLSKFYITKKLTVGQSLPVIRGVFHLTLVHNRGAAFGILRGQPLFLVATSLFAIILIYLNFKRNPQNKNKISPAPNKAPLFRPSCGVYRMSLSLILAGALGNLVDRLFLGYVVDFLDLRIWPVFNFADSAITIGAILLGYILLRQPKMNA